MIVRRDPHSGSVKIWTELEEFRYMQWADAGRDTDEPEPTVRLEREDANELIVQLLTGPPGPVGPQGVMGASGQALGDGMA